MIAHDTTLQELARRKPVTSQKLLATKGMGPSKVERYGADILEILSGAAGQEVEKTADEPADGWSPAQDAELVRQFNAGTPLTEVATHFNSTPQEVWTHLSELLKD
jgi:hypothetical protein